MAPDPKRCSHMNTLSKRTLLTSLLLALAASLAPAADTYPYDQPNDKNFVNNTAVLERQHPTTANNQSYKIPSPRAQIKAAFTSKPITIDGQREPAWDDATPYPIAHKFNATMTADAP